MNKLISEVCRILDFPLEYQDLALKEAIQKEKLLNTWMFVNGELHFINTLDYTNGTIYDGNNIIQVYSLEPWNPETGLYSYNNNLVFLSKKTNKQWQKSFNPNHYTVKYLHTSGCSVPYEILSKLEPETMHEHGEIIYFYDKSIGLISPNKVVKCIHPQFYQELIDYSNRKGLMWNVQL